MKELVFNIEFLSDVVLQATSNTEGNIDVLEFIPGSNFLGMVAKNYDKFSDSFKIFHSGLVRFMDANLLVDNQIYYKTPYSFFKKKILENNEKEYIYNHHLINKKLGQLKQLRKGFINPDISNGLKLYEINYNYSQKSSYDKIRRRSKSGNMFGYKSMPKGLKWQFKVKIDDSISKEDESLIIQSLENSTRLGKSKSSEYGKVKITKINNTQNNLEISNKDNLTYIYANSRLALVDENGYPTIDPIYLIDGLNKENILYDKMQIKTSSYRQYNNTMQNRSYERIVINKGSVFVLKDLSNEQIEKLKNGIGVFLSEGFGDLIINPKFLLESEIKVFKQSKLPQKNITKIETNFDTDILNYLKLKHNNKLSKLDLVDEVYKFIRDNKVLYKNISNSQWGTIRSICLSQMENKIVEIEKYISSGKAKWSKEQKNRLLSNSNLDFIQLVASDMPKAQGDRNAN